MQRGLDLGGRGVRGWSISRSETETTVSKRFQDCFKTVFKPFCFGFISSGGQF